MDEAGTRAAAARAAAGADFVGRQPERALLAEWLASAAQGAGRLVTVAGEAGIGKTRLLHELLAEARRSGAIALSGSCAEGAAGGAYGPFRAALDGYVSEVAEATLRSQLGPAAGVIAQLVPRLRARLPDVAEPARLQPDEERTRLLDAVSQFLIAIAARAPLVLVLDDLHWADADTLALFRHVGRAVGRHRVLLVGTYREGEMEDEGVLAQTLALLRRQPGFERMVLTGLPLAEVEALMQALAEQRTAAWTAGPVEPALAKAIGDESRGNPFFVRSLVLHLVEEGRLRVEEGRWRATTPIEDLGLPDGIRQLLQRRIGRLSEDAQSFLTVAAAVGGTFRFDVVAAVAELGDERALAAVDESLQAQLIAPAPALDSYTFVHALVRQTLYEAQNPSRRVRLHRRIAEGMERVYGDRATEHAAEIALHYHRSASLPGAERGVAYAVAAADGAAAVGAHDESATFWRIALDLSPQTDSARARLLGRLGMTLSWTLHFDEALQVAIEAGELIARVEGDRVAADYFAEAAMAMWQTGSQRHVWDLVSHGLRYVGNRRDVTWVQLMVHDIVRREAEDASNPGIVMDTQDRRAIAAVVERFPPRRLDESILLGGHGFIAGKSRQDILERLRDAPYFLMSGAGEYRTCVRIFEAKLTEFERDGRIANAVETYAFLARCHNALGALQAARTAYDHGAALFQRLSGRSRRTLSLALATWERNIATDEGWKRFPEETGQHELVTENYSSFAAIRAQSAWFCARMGLADEALMFLQSILDPLERAPGWSITYEHMPFNAAATLWLLQRTDHVEAIERNLRDKIVAADFRYPMVDARLSMAHLCALQGRYDEAVAWFAKARTVLDEQGARPLRAITDYDEALMYSRRNDAGDGDRARPLLDAALAQFRTIGMPGWIRRAEALGQEVSAGATTPAVAVASAAPPAPAARALFRAEGDFWTIVYGDRTIRLRDSRGLTLLARLLRAPGREIAATELVAGVDGQGTTDRETATSARATLGDAGELLDAPARAAYKQRIDELREELADAEHCNDLGRAESLRVELEALADELARAVGLGGRARRAGSHAERARVNATRALTLALRKIAAQHPALGEHFARTIRTGTFCSYAPDPRAPIAWET